MKTGSYFHFFSQILQKLDEMIYRAPGTIKAYKAYEKKARRDLKRTKGVRIEKNQRVPETKLLSLQECNSVEDVIQKFADPSNPDLKGYIERLAYIWCYNEKIDT